MIERTKLKRLATVDVGLPMSIARSTSCDLLTEFLNQDVAEQVLCFVKSKSVTGVNAVIDGGMAL